MRNLGGCLAQAMPEAFIGVPKAHAARVLLGWARGSVRINVSVGSKWFWGGTTLDALRAQVPAGGAFAAHALGFLAADDAVWVYETGPWIRLTTKRGHVLIKRRAGAYSAS